MVSHEVRFLSLANRPGLKALLFEVLCSFGDRA
jgi:hypothetical protein